MHIPDGYLSPSTCAVMYAATAPFWYIALQRLRKFLSSRLIPLISLMSAFSFVIMMFNIPLPGGTTGHAVGMGIASIVLGPWGAIVAISIALILQAVFFGDGGILAIGANCFNMAVVGSLVAYGIYRLLSGRAPLTSGRRVIAAAIAGYVAINAAAFLAAIEFGIQPMLFKDPNGVPLYSFYPLSVAIPAMMIGHLTFAGIAEAIVTGGIVAYLQKADPSLLRITAAGAEEGVQRASISPRRLIPLWVTLALLVVLTPLGLLASGTAWGEWGTEEVVQEQAGYYIRNLSTSERQALASDFRSLASQTSNESLRNDYNLTAQSIESGNINEAASLVQKHISSLRDANSQYGRIRDMVSNIHEPSGLKRWSSIWTAPIPGYAPSFMRSEVAGYIISAVVGILLVTLVTWLIGKIFLASRWNNES